jgi:hypothetical protein
MTDKLLTKWCMTDKLLTVEDVAARWGRSPRWVADQLRARRFPAMKVGAQWRMSEADVAAAEEIMRQPARTETPAATVHPPTGLSLTPGARRRMRRGL